MDPDQLASEGTSRYGSSLFSNEFISGFIRVFERNYMFIV